MISEEDTVPGGLDSEDERDNGDGGRLSRKGGKIGR